MINLVLALLWLGFAVFLFALPWVNPEVRPFNIPNTEISMGWFALVFFAYNLIRWRTSRPRRPNPTFLPSARARRHEADEGREANPDFNFSERPPGPPPRLPEPPPG